MEIWQGSTRHRISLVSGGPLLGNIRGEFESGTMARRWHDFLVPLVGTAPADVHVKKPVSKGVQLTLTILLSLLGVIVVLVAVFMLG